MVSDSTLTSVSESFGAAVGSVVSSLLLQAAKQIAVISSRRYDLIYFMMIPYSLSVKKEGGAGSLARPSFLIAIN